MAGLEGSTLDRYELRKLVGRGGMAEVYLGHDTKFERMVAVKVFKRTDEEMLHRFIREAKLMASLRHPHLVPIYDAGEASVDGYTQYYIVMPFMDGGTLRARIKKNPLTSVDACRYLGDIGDALDYVHSKGIIHRDIKASNVLLDKEGNCYLADFGIARTTSDATNLTSTGNVLGTVDYVAPELFEVNRRADALSDLYSLGVLLFEMVTGQLPFYAENQIALVSMHMNQPPPPPSTLVRTVSPQVERVIYRALAKKPANRYPSGQALSEAFCQAANAPAEVSQSLPATSSDLWEYSPSVPNLSNSGQRGPLILPPPITSAAPVNRQVPNTPAAAPLPGLPPLSSRPPAYQAPTSYQPQPAAYQQSQLQSPPAGVQSRRSAQERGRRQRTIILTILALLVLIGITIPIGIAWNISRSTNGATGLKGSATSVATTASTTIATATVNTTATAVANATGTAQATLNASATAVANQTATVVAGVTATPGVFGTAIASPTGAAYNDALTNANNAATKDAGWDTNGSCAFQPNGYHVTAGHNVLKQGTFSACRAASKQFDNVAIAVDVTILSGHAGGLFFRVDTGSNCCTGYLFEVDLKGEYKLSIPRAVGGTTFKDWTLMPAIHQGSQLNTLQVLARGSTLYFYVNGTFLQLVTDQSFTSGDIGFSADSANDAPDTDVQYTNLKVSPQAA